MPLKLVPMHHRVAVAVINLFKLQLLSKNICKVLKYEAASFCFVM